MMGVIRKRIRTLFAKQTLDFLYKIRGKERKSNDDDEDLDADKYGV